MGIIYKIFNSVNEKVYIGQTRQPLKRRWEHHLFLADNGDTVLYRAMKKYGKDNFYIELIEEIDNELLNEREVYWIDKFSSLAPNGYNSTLGGDGVTIYNHKEIIEYYLNVANNSMVKTALHFKCNVQTVMNIVRANNLKVQERGSWSFKPVVQLDLNGNFIAEYDSITHAAEAMSIPVANIHSVVSNNNLQKSANNYQWIYKDNYDSNKKYVYKKNNWRTIQCVETGQVFESLTEAAQWIKNNDKTLEGSVKGMTSNIGRAIRENIKAYKFHWKYVD